MLWFYCLMAGLGMAHNDASEATDWMKPATWRGNFWGPAATRARESGELPPLPTNPRLTQWAAWGKAVLKDGDVVFRLGDAKALGGVFPLSRFIAPKLEAEIVFVLGDRLEGPGVTVTQARAAIAEDSPWP